ALEDAREANAMRDTFVRLVSHELRTPLNAALTWVRLMEVDRSDETREKGVAVVAQSIESQSRLIDDLVDVSRFASTGVRLEPERVNVRQLIEATIDELRPAIEASQRLSVTIGDGDYGATIDPLRVQQIVRNLLSNATKYTPPDGRIDVELASSGETVTLRVADTGKGLAEDQAERVFEPFWRAESHQPGLGVGLAIVAALVSAHDGTIDVHSDGPGKGTAFVVTLPRSASLSSSAPLHEES
ncbi:MAG: HAMP domain-containing sensor histidine kinase, partial [Woeseiaceae bacterium]|nr:HAMP domain-containing sensor histidine kinase [Woeseiaceae bacterium]